MARTGAPAPRPRVALIAAASADGKIDTADGAGPRFASRADKAFLRQMRAESDAVVLGARTAADEDLAYRLLDALKEKRRRAGEHPTPIRAVVSGRGNVPADAPLFFGHESPALVFAGADLSPRREQELSAVARVVRSEAQSVDPRRVLAVLAEEYGVRRVLLEGGAQLNASFLEAGCVDEALLTVCPCLIGGDRLPTPVGGPGFPLEKIVRLKLESVRIAENDLFLRYSVLRAESL